MTDRPIIFSAPMIHWEPLGHSGIEMAMIGRICVGRVASRDPSYMAHLPNNTGSQFCFWRKAKTHLAAKNALIADIRDWLRNAGLQAIDVAIDDVQP